MPSADSTPLPTSGRDSAWDLASKPNPPVKANGTRPILELAAQSIADAGGASGTVVDVIHGRAFRHYAEGLRQYLTVRLGSPEEATAVLRELRASSAATGAAALVKLPGIRPRLFRMARELAERRLKQPFQPPRTGGTLRWRLSEDDQGVQQLRDRLFDSLSGEAWEAAELHHGRGLPPEEVAFVLDEPEAAVQGYLAEAATQAKEVVPGSDAEPDSLSDLFFSAFSVEQPAMETADPPSPEDMQTVGLPEGEILGERYKIETQVGSGSFADVYRAQDTQVPGHTVALKLLHQPSLSPTAKAVALRELRLIASVFHPSIVQFKDHGWFEGRLWFVMPWYEGETLEERITRKPLSRPEAQRVFGHLARALAAMHAVGVRHQDIKPDNIFLAKLKHLGLEEEDGVLPVLLDLGVAAKEAEMVVAGTPTYFAPEVAAQFASVATVHTPGPKSDVFSLALSLRNSLEPETMDDVESGAVERFVFQRATEPPTLFSKKDVKFLEGSFGQWLNLDPGERPGADDFGRQLAVLTRPEDQRARRRRILKWSIPIALAVVSVVTAIVWVLASEAKLHESRANEARAELDDETERRLALEEDVEEIRDQYESSELTREQMAGRLADTERRLRGSRREVQSERRRARTIFDKLSESRKERERLSESLTDTRNVLSTTERELSEREVQLTSTQSSLAATRAELDTQRSLTEQRESALAEAQRTAASLQVQLSQLEASAASLRAEQSTLRSSNNRLTEELRVAERSKSAIEARLTDALSRIRTLERQGGRRTSAAPSPPAASTEPPSGTAP